MIKNGKIIVNKFGGGIMIEKHIPFTEERLREQIKAGFRPVVVVSALKGVTDRIIHFLAGLKHEVCRNQQIGGNTEKFSIRLVSPFVAELKEDHLKLLEQVGVLREERKKAMTDMDKIFSGLENDLNALLRFGFLNVFDDKISAYGEKLAGVFFTAYLNSKGFTARTIMAEDIPIMTDVSFRDANIDYKVSEKNARKKILKSAGIPVIPGFTGKTANGNITTLGRGGTDTTACFLGAALRADKIILWKDVDGVLSADPKIVPSAKTVPFISYAEAEESGKIIHDKAIQYVKMFKTPAEVAAISDPAKKTLVGPAKDKKEGPKIVSFKKDLSLLIITDEKMNQRGYLAHVTGLLASRKVNLDTIRNTRDKLHIVAESYNGPIEEAVRDLKEEVAKLKIIPVNMVVLIGSLSWEMVSRFNDVLIKLCPDAELGAFPYRNCVRLEAVVRAEDTEKMIRALHEEFIK